MKRYCTILLLITSCHTLAAGEEYDYSTPEKALTSLELAYMNKDIEAAVRSKSFYFEAKEMLESRFSKDIATPEIIKETAEVLELGFRKEIKENGFPDFSSLKCSSTHKKESENIAILTEKCIFPDKGHSIQRLKAAKVDGQWKIVGILD